MFLPTSCRLWTSIQFLTCLGLACVMFLSLTWTQSTKFNIYRFTSNRKWEISEIPKFPEIATARAAAPKTIYRPKKDVPNSKVDSENIDSLQVIEISPEADSKRTEKERNGDRVARLADKCKQYKRNETREMQAAYRKYLHQSIIVVNDDAAHRLTVDQNSPLIAACIPPKTGTTNWQLLLNSILRNTSIEETAAFRKKVGNDFYSALPHLGGTQYSNNGEIVFHTTGYSKRVTLPLRLRTLVFRLQDAFGRSRGAAVLNVRHPLSRAISGWRSKFTKYKAGFEDPVTKSFITEIRVCMAMDETASIQPPKHQYCSFRSFLKLLLTQLVTRDLITSGKTNEHFVPITTFCAPCLVPYDILVKSEESASQSRVFLDRFNQTKSLTLPGKYKHTLLKGDTWSEVSKSIHSYTDTVDRNDLVKFYEVFYWDFELFGYDMSEFL